MSCGIKWEFRTIQSFSCFYCLLIFLTGASAAVADHHQPIGQAVTINGEFVNQAPIDNNDKRSNIRDNVSALALKDRLLVIGADEGADLLVFTSDGEFGELDEISCIPLDGQSCGSERKGTEVDIEGIAWGEEHVYVLGSHSRARKTVDTEKTQEENRKRLKTIKIEPSREQIFRLKVNENGELNGRIKSISLRNLFAKHPILAMFQPIPSKENGLDIEGLAVGKDEAGEDALYLGFRGPVLRGNYAMVMMLKFEKGKFNEKKIKSRQTLYFLDLHGRGIRGIAEAGNDGFLILAGPVSDAETDDPKLRYAVYLWDGKSSDLSNSPKMTPLCYVSGSDATKAKAEGIELLNKDRSAGDAYSVLIVYDSAEKGSPRKFNCEP
jgi:hypothetical protein